MRASEFHELASVVSLALFGLVILVHIFTLSGLLAPLVFLFVLLVLLVIAGQILLVVALNGGHLLTPAGFTVRDQLKLAFGGLRLVPIGWRVIGFLYLFIYAPVILILYSAPDDPILGPHSDHWAIAFSALLGVFPLMHYLGFRYVLPRREDIVRRAQSSDSARKGAI